MAEPVRIASDGLSAAISPVGAELVSLRDADDRELMTDADPAFWDKHAPLLFPIIGEAAGGVIRVDGTAYPIGRHGFARGATFTVAEASESRAVFRLTDSNATRAAWPFAFLLEVAFEVAGAVLTVTVRVGNTGTAPLWASFGFHPAFAWPLPYGRPRADHAIVFDCGEGDIAQLDAQGLIAPEPCADPLDGRVLHLTDELFARDALVWPAVRSQGVTYGADGAPKLRVEFPDTPSLGIWTKPGARFVCIEPWHGHADPAGFTGELKDKPGVLEVAPGDDRRIVMRVTLTD